LIEVSLVSLIVLAAGLTIVARRFQIDGEAKLALVQRLQHEKAENFLAAGETGKGLAVLAYLLRENPANDVVGNRLLSAVSRRSLAVPMVRPWIGGAEVLALGFSEDGRYSSTISRKGWFRRLEIATGETSDARLCSDREVLTSASLHPTAALLVTTHSDGRVMIRSPNQPEQPLAELVHESPVKMLTLGPDARAVVTVDQRNAVRWWRAVDEPGVWIANKVPELEGETITALEVHPNGTRLAVGTDSGRLIQIDGSLDPTKRIESSADQSVMVLEYSRDGRHLAVATAAGEALIWDVDGPREAVLRMPMPVTPTDLEFSPDGRWLAGAGWSRSQGAMVWDARTGELKARLSHGSHVTVVRFSPDGGELVTLGYDHQARCWAVDAWTPVGEPLVHITSPLQVAYSPDNHRLATRTYTGTVWWDVSPALEMERQFIHRSPVTRSVFSPRGDLLATGTESGQVTLWNTADGSLRQTWQAQSNEVLYLEFSHSGELLVAFGRDGVPQIWNADEGTRFGQTIVHPSPIYRAVFTADDRALQSGRSPAGHLWRGEFDAALGRANR